jgi:putative serine protease PepD
VLKLDDETFFAERPPLPRAAGLPEVTAGVAVYGYPVGGTGLSVTRGVVSRIDYDALDADTAALQIQVDAAINPGNSGGALVDCSGDLVGVPTAGATVPSPSGEASGGSIGLGFAIPVNLATKVANEIIDTGSVRHAFLGMEAEPLSVNAAPEDGKAEGLRVTGVAPGGPAASAGLRVADIITSINGSPAVSTDQLVALTLAKRAGDRVELRYRRSGRETNTTLTLASRP